MSLYAAYLKEREDLEMRECQHGFITYKFRTDACYIQDIYVLPEYRKSGEAKRLADEVVEKAKQKGYQFVLGSVDSRANGAEISDKVLRSYGLEPYTNDSFVTYYKKRIN